MHRFYLPSPEIKGNIIPFNGPEWHHSKNVLRNKDGDKIVIFDGKGNEYLVEILDYTQREARLKILSKSKTPPPPYQITLAQALPKSKAMDYIIQKASELGVREIIPVFSERSVVKLEKDEIETKLERWNEIAIDAAKQCGLNWLPKILPPRSVRDITDIRRNYHLAFIASLQPDAKRLWSYLNDFGTSRGDTIIMVGPEGDFTPAELGTARSANFQPLSLGPMVLRCDTAAIYSISTISYELSKVSHQS